MCNINIIFLCVYVALCLFVSATITILFSIYTAYTFEGNRCLLNGVLWVWSVGLPKPELDGIEDWENLLELMVPRLIPQRQASVVHKMKISRDLLEAVTGYTGGYEAVSQLLIRRPIVSNFWEMVYTHNDVKTYVRFELLSARLPCCLGICHSQTLSSIQVSLLNNLGEEGIADEVREHLQWVATDGNTRPHWRCAWLYDDR